MADSARWVAALVAAGVGRERVVQVAQMLEESAVVGSARWIAALVRTAEGGVCAGKIAAGGE